LTTHQHHHSDAGHSHHSHHGHAHHGGHHHAPIGNYNRTFSLAIALNVVFVIVEFTYGFIARSTALLADAGHNLSDVLALLLAWGAAALAKKQPTSRYTYGLRSTSILAALANAMLLLVACGAIAWEAVRRFSEPAEVAALPIIIVAAVGILINGISAWLFVAGSKNDLNIRGAFLHMAADAVVSLGVVIAGVLILTTGWAWLDPAVSLVIVAVILVGTWGLLRESVQLSLSGVPTHIDLPQVEDYLLHLPGVAAVNDLHIWGMSTTEAALTAYLVMPEGYPGDAFMENIAADLHKKFRIDHSTLQIRQASAAQACTLTR
jgi:cobalt-zinc-cadmium efflux system protein